MTFECFSYMSYIYTGNTMKRTEDNSYRGSIPKESSVRGSSPKESSVRGNIPEGK
jgi:hypothetical protein